MNRLEDYITCTQAAWLMGTSIRQVQGLAQKSKLNRIKKEDRVLIEVDSIVNFAYQKIKKYERAVQYFKNQDKVQYWKYVNGILGKYYSDFKNLFEYIDCENKDKYWMECEGIIQKNYTDVESKRRQYYKKSYVRKEKNKWESSTKN